jgi:hypothetical protein
MPHYRSTSIYASILLSLVSVVGVTACEDSAGAGGASGSTSASGTGAQMTSSTGGSCPCCLKASCVAVDKGCAGLVDNVGQSNFGLRMSSFDIAKPLSLSTGLLKSVITGAVMPAQPTCNLHGEGTFSWLLQFDTTASTLKTGFAKPVSDASAGYNFVNEMVDGLNLTPVTFTGVKPDASGKFAVTVGTDLVMPIYLDAQASAVILLPVKSVRFSMATLSSDQNCIGKYNGEQLNPDEMCFPNDMTPAFVDGGVVDGLITLEDADRTIISQLNESLCVLISGDAATYGMKNGMGQTVCARDPSTEILFKGDACSTGAGCTDAVSLIAQFAASSVKIN